MTGLRITAAALALWAGLIASNAARAADHVLLVGGLGGEEKYAREFNGTLTELRELLIWVHGYEKGRVRLLADSVTTGTSAKDMDTSSTLENLQREFARLQKEMKDSDTFLLVMIGHGQSDFREPRFNLPGPDLGAMALGAMLDALPAKDQRLILVFPCSGHFTEFLAGPFRVILASTDGPRQIYHSIMPPYLLAALKSKDADVNMDEEISFLELFEYLSREVEGYFISKSSLQTENPSLDDNGDGKVTTKAEGMDAGDGANAKKIRLSPAPSAALSESRGDAKKE